VLIGWIIKLQMFHIHSILIVKIEHISNVRKHVGLFR